MSIIEAVGHFKFPPAQRAVVTRAIDDSIRIVREQDTGTLAYEWLIGDSGDEVLVREKYVDSEALMAHAANVAAAFADLRAVAQIRVEVYGEPSPALLAMLRGMQVPVFRPLVLR